MTTKSEISMSTDTSTSTETETTATPASETNQTYGGYASVEELVAAHEALKATSTTTETAEAEAGSTETKPALEVPETPSADTAQETVESKGLDWNALNGEYAEHGKLSDETYASLDKAGIPREAVDTYIRGKQAEADAYDAGVYGAAGGAEEYASLVQWAASALTADEKAAFNQAVTSGNAASAKLAVEALAARKAAVRGTPPSNALKGSAALPAGSKPFRSQAEVTAAMNSKQYKTDPAFRAEVVERLRVSDVFG